MWLSGKCSKSKVGESKPEKSWVGAEGWEQGVEIPGCGAYTYLTYSAETIDLQTFAIALKQTGLLLVHVRLGGHCACGILTQT